MTIVVAGYEGENKAFILSDSFISERRIDGSYQPILKKYHKIRSANIKLPIPSQDLSGEVTSMRNNYDSHLGVAFAGSTLTFTHFYSYLTELLKCLRYKLVRVQGQEERIIQATTHFDPEHICYGARFCNYDPFFNTNAPAPSEEAILSCVTKAFNTRMLDIHDSRIITEQDIKSVAIEMVLAFYDEDNDCPILYKVSHELTEQIPKRMVAKVERVPLGEVVILGGYPNNSQLKSEIEKYYSDNQGICYQQVKELVNQVVQEEEPNGYIGGELQSGFLTNAGFSKNENKFHRSMTNPVGGIDYSDFDGWLQKKI